MMAPEILNQMINPSQRSYFSNVDLWSIGVIFYFMLFGKYPFHGNNFKNLLKNINRLKYKTERNKFFEPIGLAFGQTVRSFLEGLLELNPETRMNWDLFFSHQIFGAKTLTLKSFMSNSQNFGIRMLNHTQIGHRFKAMQNRRLQVCSEPMNYSMSNARKPKIIFSADDLGKLRRVAPPKKTDLDFEISVSNRVANVNRMEAILNHRINVYSFSKYEIFQSLAKLKKFKHTSFYADLTEFNFLAIFLNNARVQRDLENLKDNRILDKKITNIIRIQEDFKDCVVLKTKYIRHFNVLRGSLEKLMGKLGNFLNILERKVPIEDMKERAEALFQKIVFMGEQKLKSSLAVDHWNWNLTVYKMIHLFRHQKYLSLEKHGELFDWNLFFFNLENLENSRNVNLFLNVFRKQL